MNLDKLRTSTENIEMSAMESVCTTHTLRSCFERRRAENVACSTHVYHLMEMEAKLTNYKLIQFAITAADTTYLLQYHFTIQNE